MKEYNSAKITVISDGGTDDYNKELQSRYRMSGDGRRIAALCVALAVLIVLTVLLRYDFVHNIVTPGRYLETIASRLEDLGGLLTGKGSRNNISYSIFTVLIAGVVGSVLSTSGAVYQGIYHNPMASPSMLGVQSGGMVAATLYLLFCWDPTPATEFYTFDEYTAMLDAMSFYDIYARQIWMITGCLAGGALVVFLSTRAGRGKMSTLVLILAGVLFSSFANTFVNLVRYWFIYNDPGSVRAYAMMNISMGTFANTYSGQHFLMIGIPCVICLVLIFSQAGRLNILMFGEDEARTLGLNVNRFRNLMFLLCTIMCGIVLSFCGQIGFLGLIVPHFARKAAGSDFRLLLPFAALFGAMSMILIYFAACCTGLTSSLNLVTSAAGGAIFCYFLVRYRRQSNADWA
ncbi:MAG: FecCD family ABC transporter permease [Anaerovoracaceae bacterium]|jgi:iron complex transport system permease protein